jgi:hypothetical protein
MRLMLCMLRDIPSTIVIVCTYICIYIYIHFIMECNETDRTRRREGKGEIGPAQCKLNTREV